MSGYKAKTAIQTVNIPTSRGKFMARAVGEPDAPLALLLHGFPDSPHTFDALARGLAAAGF